MSDDPLGERDRGFSFRRNYLRQGDPSFRDREDEQRYWDSLEEEAAAEAAALEREAEEKEIALEAMKEWFFENFEDPQSEMPRDSEEGIFLYPWGGPFDARDTLHDQFSDQYKEEWINIAIDAVEHEGIYDWAPTSHGEFYEHPEEDSFEHLPIEERNVISSRILERLAALEKIVQGLPPTPISIGHNAPPEDIGLPPYSNEDRSSLFATITETRQLVETASPETEKLKLLATRFDGFGSKLGGWLAKKGDLAVDELIKSGVKAISWAGAVSLMAYLAADLADLARAMLSL